MEVQFNDLLYKKWRMVKKLSESSYIAIDPKGEFKVLRFVDFPKGQNEVFELLAQNMGFAEIEDHYQKQAKALIKNLERFNYIENVHSFLKPESFEMEKLKGQTGWRVIEIKELLMPLKVYLKYHHMDEIHVFSMAVQILDALIAGLQAGVVHGSLIPENILVIEDDRFAVDDFGISTHIKRDENLFDAPEKEKNAQSDIFSLGMLMLWILLDQDLNLTKEKEMILESIQGADILQKAIAASPEERYKNFWQMKNDILQIYPQLAEK